MYSSSKSFRSQFDPLNQSAFASPHAPNVSKRQRTNISNLTSQSPYARLVDVSMTFPNLANTSFNQSGLIGESSWHSIKSFGSLLPVIVIEAISSEVSFISLSVKISESGWSWLVCGRRLFIWKYKQPQSSRVSTCPCYELQLPPSDLSHKAQLVCVFAEKSQQVPSTIAVSPEGIIRYWPNIAYEGRWIETIANDLQGQEYILLTDISPLGCILGTTTSSLVHVTFNEIDGHSSLTCRTLKIPQGMLAGFGRKVSSFIFGAMPATQSSETKQLIKILRDDCLGSMEFEIEQYIWVLAGCSVQKWHIINHNSDRLIIDFDIERSVRDAFLDKVWNRETTHPNQLQIWPIDIALRSSGEIVLLVAGLNADVSNQLYYALAILSEKSTTLNAPLSPLSFISFLVLRNHTVCYSDDDEEQLLNLHLLTGTSNSQAVYIYNHTRVLCVLLGSDDVDVIDFTNKEDSILGAGVCDGFPLLFGKKDGIISIIPHQFDTRNVNHPADDGMDDDEISDNNIVALRKAFSVFSKGDHGKSKFLVSKLMSQSGEESIEPIMLDECVTSLSAELCDEIPTDPRWAESSNAKNSDNNAHSVVCAIILGQLEEKMQKHRRLIEFLKMSGIWTRLTTLMVKGNSISTQMCLCDHAEKLIAAMTLEKLHVDYKSMLDEAIKLVLHQRNTSIPARLTAHDLFFREVTRIDDFIEALIAHEHELINNDLTNPRDILTLIASVSHILITVFREVCAFRKQLGPTYESAPTLKCEYLPWTSSDPIRKLFNKQLDLLVNFGIDSVNITSAIDENVQLKGTIYQRLVELADIILDGFVCQLKSIDKQSELYRAIERNFESFRSRCLKPLMKVKQFDRATALAEKYEDFDVLIRICEELDNKERLERYMSQFSNKGFAEFLFNWYIKEGKQGKMMINTSQPVVLSDFLKNHEQLNWLHQIHLGKHKQASDTLKELALSEKQFIGRKKTLFSMSKLAALADGQTDLSDIDSQLCIIADYERERSCQDIQEADVAFK